MIILALALVIGCASAVNELDGTITTYSQCHPEAHCGRTATNGTGHELYRNLTEMLVDAERCYSFCFKNLSSFFEQDPFLDVYAASDEQLCLSEPWTEAFVCLSVCLSASTEGFMMSNATCVEQCSSSDICHRSLGHSVDNTSCLHNCQAVLCPLMCSTLEDDFEPTMSVEGVSHLNVSLGSFSLEYAKDINLRAQGLLEATFVSNGMSSSAGPFGVIWKVSKAGGEDSYFAQHLPFHFLPMEVGPLYRVGSNMLSIRQLQCLPGVNLSYALVNAVGVSEFSEPQEQCFYGSWYPRPPSDLHIEFDLIPPLETDLSLHIWANDISPDQQYVAEYRLDVYGGPEGDRIDCFGWKHLKTHPPTFASRATFSDKNNLSFVAQGKQQLKALLQFTSTIESCVYRFQVYAVPLGNITVPSNPPRTEIKTTLMYPNLTEVPNITLSVTVAERDHSSGTVTLQGHLYIPPSVLVNIATLRPDLTLKLTNDDGKEVPSRFSPTVYRSIETNQSDNYFNISETRPTAKMEHYLFQVHLTFVYPDFGQIPQVFEEHFIMVPAVRPSPVRNLTVNSEVNYDRSVFIVNISWTGPSQPEGRINRFEITISSRLVQELYRAVYSPSDKEAMHIMNQTFEHFAEFNLVEEEFINVTIIAASEFDVEGFPAVAQFAGIPPTTPPLNGIPVYAIVLIVLVPVFLIATVTIFMVICYWYYKKNQRVVIKNDDMILHPNDYEVPITSWLRRGEEDGDFEHPQLVDDWEICPDHIIMERFIGEGNFGEVYRGTLVHQRAAEEQGEEEEQVRQTHTVAIKVLRSDAPGELKSDFLKEITTMKKITMGNCPYVVNMVGCCTTQEPLALVLEYLSQGDLLEYLRKHRKQNYLFTLAGDLSTTPYASGGVGHNTGGPGYSTIPEATAKAAPHTQVDSARSERYTGLPELQDASSSSHDSKGNREVDAVDLVSFAHQIASGMEFLSELGIVHRDLACRNVLVGENKVLKVSDFGLARENDIYIKTTDGKLPLRWMAIESITERVYTTKSDVWSFGVVLWEIATMGALPYPEISNKMLFNRLMNGYRMDKPANCSLELYTIMMDCWSQHPSKRPSFGSIRTRLEELMNDSNRKTYIDMSTFDDLAPYETMASIRNKSSRVEEGFQESVEGTGGSREGGVAYFDRLQSESTSETGISYFDHLKSKTKKKSEDGKPYFDHLPVLQGGSENQSHTPRAENGNGNQYFDHLAREPSGNGTAGVSYFDRLTAGNNGSGNDSHTGNGNSSLTVTITGCTLSSLSQNTPLSPNSQVAMGDQSSCRSHRDADEISICSQHIEELDTAM